MNIKCKPTHSNKRTIKTLILILQNPLGLSEENIKAVLPQKSPRNIYSRLRKEYGIEYDKIKNSNPNTGTRWSTYFLPSPVEAHKLICVIIAKSRKYGIEVDCESNLRALADAFPEI